MFDDVSEVFGHSKAVTDEDHHLLAADTLDNFESCPVERFRCIARVPGQAGGTVAFPSGCEPSYHIMEVALQYTKKRSEFGHHCTFEDVPAQVLESVGARYEGIVDA